LPTPSEPSIIALEQRIDGSIWPPPETHPTGRGLFLSQTRRGKQILTDRDPDLISRAYGAGMSTPRALRDQPIPLRPDRAALLTHERRGLMRGLASPSPPARKLIPRSCSNVGPQLSDQFRQQLTDLGLQIGALIGEALFDVLPPTRRLGICQLSRQLGGRRILRAFAQARPAQQRVFRYNAQPLSDGL
jgi:hypothetical protein